MLQVRDTDTDSEPSRECESHASLPSHPQSCPLTPVCRLLTAHLVFTCPHFTSGQFSAKYESPREEPPGWKSKEKGSIHDKLLWYIR